ncbi:hypothetical protein BX600DRAFT_443544 [Xylariales sp. PMI_506]|nr:hypothetical protein BX600DRAFT_443544 [Xylariales sp. PMI_506]
MACNEQNQKHHVFIKNILQSNFGILTDSYVISEFEQAKNNHVYLIEIAHPTVEPILLADAPQQTQYYTSAIPGETCRLVFRIPKDNVSLVDSVRICNEVGLLSLARNALADGYSHLIPQVYGCGDGDDNGND